MTTAATVTPSPQSLPENLTALPNSYVLRSILAVLAIISFFGLYILMVYGLSLLFYWALSYPMIDVNKFTIFLKLAAIAGTGMLLVFTLKFIFKLKNHKPENRIKLTKTQYPELWKFVLDICNETGAPKPKNIYADPDVNAYVSYTNIWLSLLFPVKKELTIGLGLVCTLNMQEFKAVISHEFGHFAQRSMKIGSFIVSANTIIHDMIYSRDSWDRALDQWKSTDIRLSAAAWIISPIIWLIRQILILFYQFLNIMYSSLSREMEFNADKVAVSTSGSDAIISGLWKLDFGFNFWNNTMSHLYLAGQKNQFIKNLYRHNLKLIDDNMNLIVESHSKLEDHPNGGKLYFTSSENSKVGMYASHPPNDLRQENAKDPFVTCELDSRSPWILFKNSSLLQEEMTQLVYSQYLQKHPKEYITESEFNAFVNEENAGIEILEEFHNTFGDRFFHTPELDELEKANLRGFNADFFEKHLAKLEELMKPVILLNNEMIKAQQFAEGTLNQKSFTYKKSVYNKKNLWIAFKQMNEEREKIYIENLKPWDIEFCLYTMAISKEVNKEDQLLRLIRQHKEFNEFFQLLLGTQNNIYTHLEDIQKRGDVHQNEIGQFADDIKNTIREFNLKLDDLCQNDFVELSNIKSPEELRNAIITNGQFEVRTGPIFENNGFNETMVDIERAISHCQRIDQKSIINILEFNKECREAYSSALN